MIRGAIHMMSAFNFRVRSRAAATFIALMFAGGLAVGAAAAQGSGDVFAPSTAAKLVAPNELRAAFGANATARQRVIVTYRAPVVATNRSAPAATQDATLRTANANAAASLVSRVLGSSSAPRVGGGGGPHGAKAMKFTPNIVIQLTPAEVDAFAADPDVVSVQLDRAVPPTMDVSTAHIGMPFTWATGGEGNGRTVAVIDTGVKRDHEFIGASRVVYEACYNTNSAGASTSRCPGGVETVENQAGAAADCLDGTVAGCGHGTHVAGTMVGSNTNFTSGEPLKGVALKSSLIAINVFSIFTPTQCQSANPCLLATYGDIIEGLNQVYELREDYSIDAVNMSLGGGQFQDACDTDPTKPAIDLLRSVGIATVIAAGNDGYNLEVGAPGCVSTAVTVAASERSADTISSFTNWGNLVDLVAPGVGIVSSVPGTSAGAISSYGAKSGTSMAAPHVAGVFAALKSCAPTKTLSEIETALASTGASVSWFSITKPRVNVAAAAKALGCRVPVTLTVTTDQNPAGSAPGQTPTWSAVASSPYPVTLGDITIKFLATALTTPFSTTDTQGDVTGTTKTFNHTVAPSIAATTYRVWAEMDATDEYNAPTSSVFFQSIRNSGATLSPDVTLEVKNINTSSGPGTTTASLGEDVTIRVSVASPSQATPLASGQVAIHNNGELIHFGSLDASGAFTVQNSSLPSGLHSISAIYEGDPDFLPVSTNPLSLVVLNTGTTPSNVSLSASPNPSTFGQQVTLRAVVTGSGGPTGNVTFFDGLTNLGTVALVNQSGNQVAELTTSALPGGVHSLSAEYSGSATHAASFSDNVSLTVNPGSTTTTLTVPVTGLPGATPIGISATVAPVAPATVTPTGSVQFRRNNVLVGTATLVNGVANLNLTNSPFGYSSITARFLPTTDYSFSDSAARNLLITYALGASEFRVNAGAAFNQNAPSAARLGAGAVVAFNSQSALNGPVGIRHRLIAANGALIGPSDGLVTLPATGVGAPHVAGLTNGDFVVTWHQSNGVASHDIFARRFAPNGTPRGGAIWVNSVIAGSQLNPQVAALPAGRFVIVWQSPGVDGSGSGIAQRRYLANGMAAGPQTVVNSTTLGDQTNPVIATAADGTLAVAFLSRATATAPLKFLWRAFRPTGVPAFADAVGDGSVFPAPPTIAITALSTTRFAMAWDRNETAGITLNRDVFMARFTTAGARDGLVTRVNTTQAGSQYDPSITAYSLGRFVVGYSAPDTSLTGIDAQNFAATGARANVPFFLNQTAASRQHQLSLAPLGGGTLVLGVWTSTGQDGSGEGVFARFMRGP